MIIKIDTKVWCTQKEYAKLTGKTMQAVSMGVAAGRIESWIVPVIGIRLVKRPA